MADPSSSRPPARRLYACLLLLCIAGALALAAIAAIPDESLRLSLVLVDRDASRHFLTPNQLFVVKAGAAALDLSQPYLTEFTEPRLITTTEYLEVWVTERR